MNIDRTKLVGLLEMDGVPPGVRQAMTADGLEAWMPALRRFDAAGIVFGHYNDQTLECMTIKARVVIEDEHDVQHAGVKAKLHLDIDDYSQGYGDGVTAKLKRHIKPEYFTREDDEDVELLDHDALFEAIASGEDVWVEAKPANAKPKKRR